MPARANPTKTKTGQAKQAGRPGRSETNGKAGKSGRSAQSRATEQGRASVPPQGTVPRRPTQATQPTPPTTEWISRGECARRLGVTAMMVTYYVRGGMPSRAADKLVPWPEALEWHETYVVPHRSGSWGYRQRKKEEQEQGPQQGKGREQGRRQQSSTATVNGKEERVAAPLSPVSPLYTPNHTHGGTESLAEALLRKEIALADQQRLKADEMASRLIDRNEASRWYANLIVKLRDTFMRVGAETADRLANETSVVVCRKIIDEKIVEALSMMKEYRA